MPKTNPKPLPKIDPAHRIITFREVKARTGDRSTATYYRWMEKGFFPRPIKIGPNSNGWHESTINEWVEDPEAWREKHAAA